MLIKMCEKRKVHNKLNREQILQQFEEVHGDTFDYSKVVYVDVNTPVEVYCKKHDFTFFPTPKNHKNGSRCIYCGREAQIEKAKKGFDIFKKEMFEIYGDKYDFSDSNYVNVKTSLKAVCKIHREFEKAPYSLLNGSACDECAKNTKSNNKDIFIEEATKVYGDKDDYTSTEIVSAKDKITVRCTKHNHTFTKSIQTYLLGYGCPKCSAENYSLIRTKTTDKFIEESREIHEDRFDYTDTVYTLCTNKLKVMCKKHNHTFEILPDGHIKAQTGGCKHCQFDLMSQKFKGREGTCGYTKLGYIKQASGKECRVYLIKCWNKEEEFYKIGKTFLDINVRFTKSNMPYNFIEIGHIKGDAGFIYDLEKKIHRKYKVYKYRPENWFAGYTECFNKELLIEDIWTIL